MHVYYILGMFTLRKSITAWAARGGGSRYRWVPGECIAKMHVYTVHVSFLIGNVCLAVVCVCVRNCALHSFPALSHAGHPPRGVRSRQQFKVAHW